MAVRPAFISTDISEDMYYKEEFFEFQFYSGFAVSQKQKSVKSLHESIQKKYLERRVLEVSTKSTEPLGVALSAFNLFYTDPETGDRYHLENIFQSSKVFENGGPYRDLLEVSPKDAKKDSRLRNSGELKCFDLKGEKWELEPKTMFYDWIYINSLAYDKRLSQALIESGYEIFTDIEFNHNKSFNCQARSVAIFLSLYRRNELKEALESKESFKRVYGIEATVNNGEGDQIGMSLSFQ